MRTNGLNQPRTPFFVLAILLLHLLMPATGAFSRQSGFDFKVEKEQLNQALTRLRAATGASIAFNKEEVGSVTVMPAVYKDKTIGQILSSLLSGLPFSADQKAGVWLIRKTPSLVAKRASEEVWGTVTGAIRDEDNNDPIPGAVVKINEQFIVTDIDGNFSIQLKKGTYEASITSVGYGSKLVEKIIVTGNQVFTLYVLLKRNNGQLSGVVVKSSARQETVTALYARQKNAAGISDGISAEQIARTPDKNIGEVMKRISGVAAMDNKFVVVRGLSERYNGAMLNGQLMPSTELNRKQFSFDIIPTALVDNVVVYKTVTPDQSAEFGGGLLAVTTKAIPVKDFVTVSGGLSYNDRTTGKDFRTTRLEGREFFGQASQHRQLFGSNNWTNTDDIRAAYTDKGNNVNAFNNNWALYRMNAPLSRNLDASFGKVLKVGSRNKLGIIGAITFRNTFQNQDIFSTTRDTYVYYEGIRYGLTANTSALAGVGYAGKNCKLSLQSVYLQVNDQQMVLGAGMKEDPSAYMVGYYDLAQQTGMWQNQLKGEHNMGRKGIKFNWMLNALRLDRQRPDNHQFLATLPKADNKLAFEEDIHIQGPMSNGISEGALRWWTRALEKNLSWNTDLSVPVNFRAGSVAVNNLFKAGYAGWHKNRSFYVLNTGSKLFNTEYFPALSNAFSADRGGEIYIGSFSDDFKKAAALHAGYLMLDSKIGQRFRIAGGVRAEFYNLNKANAALDSVFSGINQGRPDADKLDYSELLSREPNWNFFPSVNLTYSLTPQMNLRVAYVKSIIRPDLRELSFFREYDFELGGNYEGRLIRSTLAQHYDFRYEWYPGPGEVVSFSLFYKHLDYPMEIYKQNNVRMYEIRNSKKAINKGLEVEFRKTLAFTGMPVVRDLTVYGNFTMLRGKVTPLVVDYNRLDPTGTKVLPVETELPEEDRLQVGASNYMMNAGLFYDHKWLSLSSTFNYVTNRMYLPYEIYAESIFERPAMGLDAQVAVKFLRNKGELKLNLANLLNSYAVLYQNRYEEGSTWPGGDLHQKPTTRQLLYQEKDDVPFLRAKPGKTISVSFSYHF